MSIRVLKPNKIDEYFIRKLDISDGKEESIFTDFDTMKKLPIEQRFKEFGFWHEPKHFFTDIIEDTTYRKKYNNKAIAVKFHFDQNELKKSNLLNFSFAYSIPGMQNVVNHTSPTPDKAYSSTFKALHHIDKMKYTISFENSLKPKDFKFEIACSQKEPTPLDDVNISENLFYKTYSTTISKPTINDKIKAEWKLI